MSTNWNTINLFKHKKRVLLLFIYFKGNRVLEQVAWIGTMDSPSLKIFRPPVHDPQYAQWWQVGVGNLHCLPTTAVICWSILHSCYGILWLELFQDSSTRISAIRIQKLATDKHQQTIPWEAWRAKPTFIVWKLKKKKQTKQHVVGNTSLQSQDEPTLLCNALQKERDEQQPLAWWYWKAR